VKWTVSGQCGHRGQPVTRTVVDTDVVCVIVRLHRTMDSTVMAAASALTTAHSCSAPVCQSRLYLLIIHIDSLLPVNHHRRTYTRVYTVHCGPKKHATLFYILILLEGLKIYFVPQKTRMNTLRSLKCTQTRQQTNS